MYIISS